MERFIAATRDGRRNRFEAASGRAQLADEKASYDAAKAAYEAEHPAEAEVA